MIKLEFDSIDDFKRAIGKPTDYELRVVVQNMGHFLQNTSKPNERQYMLGTFIVLNAERFIDPAEWEKLHVEARKADASAG